MVKGRKPVSVAMCRGVRNRDGMHVSVRVHHRDDDCDAVLVDGKLKRGVDEEEIAVVIDEMPGQWHHYRQPVDPTTPICL